MMKAHGKFLKAINLKLDGRLSPMDEEMLNSHLETCVACKKEYEILATLKSSLAKSKEIDTDTYTREMRINRIMASVRENAVSGRKAKYATVLRPAIGLVTVAIVLLTTLTMLNRPTSPGNGLFTNADDLEFDTMLVHEILNQHEIAAAFEVFNQPLIIAGEIEVNSQNGGEDRG